MTFELLIVGSGPAGVSAALWARSRDLQALMLESGDSPGGQLHHVHFQPRDLPGLSGGTGPEVAAIFAVQLRDAAIDVRYGVTVASLDLAHDGSGRPVVVTADGERISSQAVLVVTGARRRRLDVPGEREFEERGVSYSATRDREQLRGRTVAVVGGGDAAYENALILAAAECDVTLVVRESPRARREFRDRVAAEPRIRIVQRARVTALRGGARLDTLMLAGPAGESRLAVEGVVIKVGDVPNTECCRGKLDLDADGYVVVDRRFRTSCPSVWAAGDVVRSPLPSIAVAIGTAALAVADIRAELKGR